MKKIGGIQVIRAIAANMVMVSHLAAVESKYGAGYAMLPPLHQVGVYGVHIFFVVSGIVMALLAEQPLGGGRFLWDRVTRIYPAYWLYTALALAVAYVAPGAVNASFTETPSILKSLLLWPQSSLPWLAVGWSLIHEMYFYIVMTLIIAFRINLIAALMLWSLILALPIQHSSPEMGIVLNPMTYEFIGGAVIGLLVSRWPRNWPTVRWLEKIGDASYSIYLSHVFVLSAMGRLYASIPHHSYASGILFLAASIVAANVWGLLSYRFIEKPILNAFRPSPDLSRGEHFQPSTETKLNPAAVAPNKR